MRLHIPLVRSGAWIALLVLLVLAACGDDVSTLPPLPPDTILHVELTRRGDDVDASVLVLENHGRPASAFQWQITDEVDRLARSVPPLDDRWHHVEGEAITLDGLFARHDGPAESDRLRLWVRSANASGTLDETPAFATITRGGRLVPDPVVDFPELLKGNSCLSTAMTFTFGWSVNGLHEGGRFSTRHAWLRTAGEAVRCMTRAEIAALDLASLVPEEAWSEWRAYDPDALVLDPARSATLDVFAQSGGAVGDTYLLFVQARDDEGQVISRSFDLWRNVFYVRAVEGNVPTLTVVGPDFAVRSVQGTPPPVHDVVPAGSEFEIGFAGSAAAYGGYVRAYRWGIDVADPADPEDEGWSVPWQISTDRPAPSPPPLRWTAEAGARRLVFATMDQAGAVARAVFDLDVFAVASWEQRRPLLLVEDVSNVPAQVRAQWRARWVEHLQAIVPEFDPVIDLVDANTDADRLDAEKIYSYRGVVWFVHRADVLPSRLVREGSMQRVNWLALFQQHGNLLLVGGGAAAAATEGHFTEVDYRQQRPPSGVGTVFVSDPQFHWGERQWMRRGFGVQTARAVDVFTGIIDYQPHLPCEGLVRADRSQVLVDRLPSAQAVTDLLATTERIDAHTAGSVLAGYLEEQYDLDVCCAPIEPTEATVPMFVHRARRDLYPEAIGGTCPIPPDALTGRSRLDGATIGVLSSVHADRKAHPGALDALWGFNPMGFEDENLRLALAWLIGENWGLGATER